MSLKRGRCSHVGILGRKCSDEKRSRTTMALTEDLQRCRRMVAGMRSLVMASSLRLQLLGEVQVALEDRDRRLAQLSTNKTEPNTPRRRYVHHFRTARIRVIQRQWRKHRLQRIIADNMKLERKWRAKRGNKRMEKSATDIQRVYRGFCARKRLHEADTPSILALIVQAQKLSRLEQLRADRKQFHLRLQARLAELNQEKRNLGTVTSEKAKTERKITKAATATAAAPATKKASVLFIDTKLLDGTVVRMEAHQLLVHQSNEVERLITTIEGVEKEVERLQDADPVVHRAASSIQCQFRNYLAYKRKQALLHRQRTARLRLRLSSDRCYDRMNVGFLQRQRELWNRCAKIIAGLYHIIVAKRLLHHYRQKCAVALIERVYTQKRDRVNAQARVAWRQSKLRAELFALRRLRRRTAHCWRDWRGFTAFEKQRKVCITQALEDGDTKWISSKARYLQRVFRRIMARRHTLTEQIVPVLHPVLFQTLKTTSSLPVEPREQFLRFYQQIIQEMHSWRVPSSHVYTIAQRYALPLDVLPIDEIWTWLLSQPQDDVLSSSSKPWFFDLGVPHTTRALLFLASTSRYYDLHDRVTFQLDQICLHVEARLTVRHYLQQLYTHDAIVYTSTVTFSSTQREKAVQHLQQLIDEDSVAIPGNFATAFEEREPPFTSFHCVWTDLCEQCLNMHCGRLARVCESCGHRRVERSTAAQASHAAVAQPVALTLETHKPPRWIRENERCDFMVINAFFHALAPRGHVHREMYPPETLWKIALAKAYDSVTILYEKYEIRTLDELIQYGDLHKATGLKAWEGFLPVQVIEKLELFLQILREELLAIQKEGMMWH